MPPRVWVGNGKGDEYSGKGGKFGGMGKGKGKDVVYDFEELEQVPPPPVAGGALCRAARSIPDTRSRSPKAKVNMLS